MQVHPQSPGGGYGWRWDLEKRLDNQAFLYNSSVPFVYLREADLPDTVDPRGKVKIKNQGQVGACSGFAASYCCQGLHNGIGADGVIFSEMWPYLMGQIQDDLIGRDTGATISGVLKGLRSAGICRQSLFPFPGRYTTNIPNEQECRADAERYQILAHSPIRSADDVRRAIGSGYPVYCGVIWGNEMNNAKVDRYIGNGGGGHALALLGYSSYGVMGPNSWGEEWGERGWFHWSWSAVDAMIRHQHSEFFALSDIERPDNPTPNRWDFGSGKLFV